jgi:hypothetical protein
MLAGATDLIATLTRVAVGEFEVHLRPHEGTPAIGLTRSASTWYTRGDVTKRRSNTGWKHRR